MFQADMEVLTQIPPTCLTTDDPATTDLATTDLATTDLATTDPATTDPATTDPATTDPATTDLATTDLATTDLTTDQMAATAAPYFAHTHRMAVKPSCTGRHRFGLVLALGVVLLFVLLAGCTSERHSSSPQKLIVSGSSTLIPVLENASTHLTQAHPELLFEFQSSGSLVGQRQLVSGSVGVVCSDIPMNPQQAHRFAETPFATTPIAVITHPGVRVETLSLERLRQLLTGEVQNWSQFGGSDLPVVAIVRSEFSGIWHTVEQAVTRGDAVSARSHFAASHAEMIRLVEQTPGAIGFAAGYAFDASKVAVVAVNGVLPQKANVLSGAYPLLTTSRLIHSRTPDQATQLLIEFVTGKVFAAYLSAFDFIPLISQQGADPLSIDTSVQRRATVKPWEILGMVLAGTGLFLMGMRLIASSLKKMANRRLRTLLQKWTRNRLQGAVWGVLCGAVSQSSTSSGFLLSGFVASGMIPLRNAMFILSWADVGTTLLVFLAAVNFKLMILYFLAFSTIAFSFDKRKKYDALLTACIGLSLLLFGFDLVKSTTPQLTQLAWVQSLMGLTAESYVMLLVLGCLLRIATQSSSVVTLLSIPLVMSGMLTANQSFAMICGTCIGSAAAAMLLSGDLKGTTKQLILFKAMTDLITEWGYLV
jgi:ABC-type phosphate transport system substrate-binding protein